MFPTPFGENLPPGLDGVVESQALDTATIQEIADRLTISVREDVSRDKTAVARLKTKLVKGVSMDMRLARADNLTPAAQRMRQAAEVSLADDDAEIMRIAPRLNSYLPAEATTVGGTGFPSPGAPGASPVPRAQPPIRPPGTGANCTPPPGSTAPFPGCVSARQTAPPFDLRPAPPPPGYHRVVDALGLCWDCPDDGGGGGDAGGGGGGGPPVPPICPPVPDCPPPRPCEPCPVGIPPGGSLPRVAICPVGIPDNTPTAAVYIVPWQYPGDSTPSSYSDCGKKLIADSLWRDFPAEEFAAALQDFTLLSDWLGFSAEPPPADDSPDEYAPILPGGYLQ